MPASWLPPKPAGRARGGRASSGLPISRHTACPSARSSPAPTLATDIVGVAGEEGARAWWDEDAQEGLDSVAVDTSAGFKQWGMLVRSMGPTTSVAVFGGLALTVACLLVWQLSTGNWCAPALPAPAGVGGWTHPHHHLPALPAG